jgi:hypothetical protein
LSLLFSDFELKAAGNDVGSAVYSTTWHLKLQPGERVVVATADVRGFMSSSGARPEPTPVAAPATPTEPATTSTEPTTGAAATAPQPATPPPPPKPVAGNGVATVVVTVAGRSSTLQWRDTTGEGANHTESVATSFVSAPAELRNGGAVPVTVSVELNSNGSTNSITQIDSLDLRLFVDNVPEPTPVVPAEPAPATPSEQPATPTNP